MPTTIHKTTKKRTTDLIIGRGLIAHETIAQELRERLLALYDRRNSFASDLHRLHEARQILTEFEPLLVENIANSDLAAWIAGYDEVAKKLPSDVLATFARMLGGPPRPPGSLILPPLFGDDEPIVRFPLIERAAESLARRRILTPDQFRQADADAKARAFTVARESSEDTLATIRDVLAETVDQGASLEAFKRNLGPALEKSFIGPGHLENVFRTNVQAAFHAGHDELADDPIVAEVFPYMEILPIRDARARSTHLSLARLGLSGTGIYRRDDKAFWALFMPPIEWNCRCGVNLMTIDAAARAGVREAQEWLRTGNKPVLQSRLQFIPWRPDPLFVGLAGQAA
ncbi:MAG: phage head morphogenesis protein [Planctomycetes bacterium]|nr:phage head morphogenesis protein [Planctomycetota bacterium]